MDADWSGIRSGPLVAGERVSLFDQKGRRHSIKLTPGSTFHTTRGGINHDELIGGPDGVVVTSAKGITYLALRPHVVTAGQRITGAVLVLVLCFLVCLPLAVGAGYSLSQAGLVR